MIKLMSHIHECPQCGSRWACLDNPCPGGKIYCCPKCHREIVPTKDNKNPAAVALGRLGGLKGGKARARKMTPEQRSEAARKAANARWQSYKKDSI